VAGKGKAAGPEVKRGRTDLAETLWQSSNPYKDGRSLGDQWLDAKGKQRVEGPEMRRGRRVMPLSAMHCNFRHGTMLKSHVACMCVCVCVCVCVCERAGMNGIAMAVVDVYA